MPPTPPARSIETGNDPQVRQRQQLVENLAVLIIRQHRRLVRELQPDKPDFDPSGNLRPS
jgi:hypothetical protein